MANIIMSIIAFVLGGVIALILFLVNKKPPAAVVAVIIILIVGSLLLFFVGSVDLISKYTQSIANDKATHPSTAAKVEKSESPVATLSGKDAYKSYDIGGICVVKLYTYKFDDSFEYMNNLGNTNWNHSGESQQHLFIEVAIQNTSNDAINLTKWLKGKIVYNGKYEYEIKFAQINPDDYYYEYMTNNMKDINPLIEVKVQIRSLVPNIVETGNESINLILFENGQEYIIPIR